MANVKEAAKMYEFVKNIKALETPVKLNSKIAPLTVMQLAIVVEQGIASSGPDSLVKRLIGEEELGKLRDFIGELLDGEGLGDFYKTIREHPAQA